MKYIVRTIGYKYPYSFFSKKNGYISVNGNYNEKNSVVTSLKIARNIVKYTKKRFELKPKNDTLYGIFNLIATYSCDNIEIKIEEYAPEN